MGKHLPPPKQRKALPGLNIKIPKIEELLKREQPQGTGEYEYGFGQNQVLLIFFAAVIYFMAWRLHTGGWIRRVSFWLPCMVLALETGRRALESALAKDFMQRDIIVLLSALVLILLGEDAAAAGLLIMYRVGRLAEAYSVSRTENCKKRLDSLCADMANRETEHGLEPVDIRAICEGEIIVVSPGEIIPLDGVITEGESEISTAPLTGESGVRRVGAGSAVTSGCINTGALIKLRVTKPAETSLAFRLREQASAAVNIRSGAERTAAAFSRLYTPVIVAAAVIAAVVPPLFNGAWRDWLCRGATLLIISTPCAVSLSVSLAYRAGLYSLRRSGTSVRGAAVLSTLARTDNIILSKTGVISGGEYELVGIYPAGSFTEQELLAAACRAESGSGHPMARLIRSLSGENECDEGVLQIEERPGKGVSAFVEGHHVYVGNAALLEEQGIRYAQPARAGAAIHVAIDSSYMGHLIVTDRVREGAFDALEAVRHMGVNSIVMLTGDVLSIARPLASSLNFDMVKAELSAEGKASAVEYLMATKAEKSVLSYVGDGETDGDIMARADLGLAFNAAAAEKEIESAEVLILGDDIGRLPCTLGIARLTAGVVRENVLAVMGAKLAMVCLAVLGALPPAIAALADALLLVFVMINSARVNSFDVMMEKRYIHDEHL